MVRWAVVEEYDAGRWDEKLRSFPAFSLFQTYAWGEYKRRFGWHPYRVAAYDDTNRITAMIQALFRRYPLSTGLVWVPGGPGGDLSTVGSGFFSFLQSAAGVKRMFCRFYPTRENNPEDAAILTAAGMRKARSALNSGLSMLYDLSEDEERPQATKNWRHNLRRSGKHNLTVRMWERPDVGAMLSVYERMELLKNIGTQYSREELTEIFDTLGEKIVLYRCDNANGELLGFRGCAIVGGKGWDLLAAVTAEGRRVYASYALFDALVRHCRSSGVVHYDMGGVDPIGNPGVYDFKKGTGAVLQEYLGEWDWATPRLLIPVVNRLVARRRGGF